MINQDILRIDTKRIKWEYGITYKEIAEDLLDMNYRAFINWIHNRCDLSSGRASSLREYIDCFL